MKKRSCFIIVIVSIFTVFLFCNNEARATTQTCKLSMGQKSQLSVSNLNYVHIDFPDGKGKVRVNMTNITSSGTKYVTEGYKTVEYPFTNDPNYNSLNLCFVNVFISEALQYFSVIPGQTSISFDLELVEDYEESLSITLDRLSDLGFNRVTTFDIEIQPTDSWIPKSEKVPGTQESTTEMDEEENITDTKTEAKGKICQQEDCYSNKCEIIIDVKEQKKVRLYRKSSKKGKYKFVKQMYNGEDLDYETFYDKGLKPNKQYWYKIETLDWDSKIWSEKSSAKSYWTAPEKVKVKRSGNTLRWNKVKGATEYMVVEYWSEKVGYNIFWQVLTDYCEKSYLTKGRTYSLKHQDDYDVYAIAKHGGYYYSNSGDISKKITGLKHYERNRHVG